MDVRMGIKTLLVSILLSVVLLAGITSCSRSKVINGIEVTELLLVVANEQNTDYCKMLRKAVEGDIPSIRQLTLLEISDGASYDHGAVIVDLIEQVGEDIFVQALDSISLKQKEQIKSYIKAGLEYGSHIEWNSQMFEDVFPKTYAFLN